MAGLENVTDTNRQTGHIVLAGQLNLRCVFGFVVVDSCIDLCALGQCVLSNANQRVALAAIAGNADVLALVIVCGAGQCPCRSQLIGRTEEVTVVLAFQANHATVLAGNAVFEGKVGGSRASAVLDLVVTAVQFCCADYVGNAQVVGLVLVGVGCRVNGLLIATAERQVASGVLQRRADLAALAHGAGLLTHGTTQTCREAAEGAVIFDHVRVANQCRTGWQPRVGSVVTDCQRI